MPKSVALMLKYSKPFMSPNITAQYNPQQLNNNSCSTSQIDAPKSNFIVSAAGVKQKNRPISRVVIGQEVDHRS